MSKILIKVIPEAGSAEPSSAEFTSAFKAFFDIPGITALFDKLLEEGDVTLAFRNQPDARWIPDSREIMLPISLLQASPVLSYINIAMVLCEITGRPLNDAYFIMLRAKYNSPAAFEHLANQVNITPDKLLFEYCFRASLTALTPAQVNMLHHAKLNIDYSGLDKERQGPVNNLFGMLVRMPSFRALVDAMTNDRVLSTSFVNQTKLPPGVAVSMNDKSYILINKDAHLLSITLDLVRNLVGNSLPNVFVKYSGFKNPEEYANAFLESCYDLEYCTAREMVNLLSDRNANALMSIILNLPIFSETIQTKLNYLLEHYQKLVNSSYMEYRKSNAEIYEKSIKDYQTWYMARHPASTPPTADSSASSSRVLVDDEESTSKPLTTSFQNFQQVEAASSENIYQTGSQFSDFIQKYVDKYKTYACSDARNYSQCIYPGMESDIVTRYNSKPLHHLEFEAQANTHAARGIYTPFTMKKIAELIDKAKSGCCTTFAISAAHQLLKHHSNISIQMVASPIQGITAHCFLLVQNKDNKSDVVIADPWLASLGWEGVFTPETYPFKHYFAEELICLFDSEQPPKPTRTHKL